MKLKLLTVIVATLLALGLVIVPAQAQNELPPEDVVLIGQPVGSTHKGYKVVKNSGLFPKDGIRPTRENYAKYSHNLTGDLTRPDDPRSLTKGVGEPVGLQFPTIIPGMMFGKKEVKKGRLAAGTIVNMLKKENFAIYTTTEKEVGDKTLVHHWVLRKIDSPRICNNYSIEAYTPFLKKSERCKPKPKPTPTCEPKPTATPTCTPQPTATPTCEPKPTATPTCPPTPCVTCPPQYIVVGQGSSPTLYREGKKVAGAKVRTRESRDLVRGSIRVGGKRGKGQFKGPNPYQPPAVPPPPGQQPPPPGPQPPPPGGGTQPTLPNPNQQGMPPGGQPNGTYIPPPGGIGNWQNWVIPP